VLVGGGAGGSRLLVVWSGGRRRDSYNFYHSPKESGTDPLNFGLPTSCIPPSSVLGDLQL